MWEGMGKSTSINVSNNLFHFFSKGLGRILVLKAPEMDEESRRDILVKPFGLRLKSPRVTSE